MNPASEWIDLEVVSNGGWRSLVEFDGRISAVHELPVRVFKHEDELDLMKVLGELIQASEDGIITATSHQFLDFHGVLVVASHLISQSRKLFSCLRHFLRCVLVLEGTLKLSPLHDCRVPEQEVLFDLPEAGQELRNLVSGL